MSDHFADVSKTIDRPKGAKKKMMILCFQDMPVTKYLVEKLKFSFEAEVNSKIDRLALSQKYRVSLIVFDNEVSPNDLADITYHHFTGNTEMERTAFIPN